MIVKGEVIGARVFSSGAAQIFVSGEPQTSEKVKCYGRMIYTLWQGRGTYDFNNPPRLLGASCTAFVGREESGIIELNLPTKGGEKA